MAGTGKHDDKNKDAWQEQGNKTTTGADKHDNRIREIKQETGNTQRQEQENRTAGAGK